MNSKTAARLIAPLVLTLAACSGKPDPVLQTASSEAPIIADPADWHTRSKTSKDGTTVLTEQVLSTETREALRKQYRRTNLVMLPIHSKYNVDLFQITDETIQQYRKAAFYAPKIYAYEAQNGASFAARHNGDGTESITFNIALVDPSRTTLQDARASSEMELPQAYRGKNLDELQSYVSNHFGLSDDLSRLPGCPKKILIREGRNEFDVTPRLLAASDNCAINTPTQVTLTVPNEEANYIRQVALYTGTVEVSALFEARVSYPLSKVHVEIDRKKLFENLEMEFGLHTPWADTGVKKSVKRILENQIMEVSVQGTTSENLSRILNKVVEEFFVPFAADPGSDQKSCEGTKAVVCLRLNLQSVEQSKKLEFNWSEEENQLSGQNYLTTTKLNALDDKASVLGSNAGACTGADCRLMSNDGKSFETGLTVDEDDVLVVEPNVMVAYQRAGIAPQIQHFVRKECVRMVSRRMSHGDHEDYCGQEEDHGPTQYTYNYGEATPLTLPDPMGHTEELLAGIWLRFKGGDHPVECPLSDFVPFQSQGNGKNLRVVLRNNARCKPFDGKQGENTRMLSVQNRIQWTPQSFDFGVKTLSYNGQVISNNVQSQVYQPRVDIGGKIYIMGSGFQALAPRGRLAE